MDKKEEEQKIRSDPYSYILDFMDKNLVVTGKQAFKILALMPVSLTLPDINNTSLNIRSNINNILIGSPGVGKSSIAKKLEKFSYNPLVRRTITEGDLIQQAEEMKWMSLIIEDITQTMDEDFGVIKAIEGIVGEERAINKSTMRTKYTSEVKGTALLCATPHDLERLFIKIESGLLSRCTLTVIRLNAKDYNTIAEFINLKAGDKQYAEEMNLRENVIIEFYEELRMIQRGRHEEWLIEKYGKTHGKTIIKPTKEYNIKMKFKQDLINKWKKISENLIKQGYFPDTRSLQEYYRFLIALAFLNIHKRNSDNGILNPLESDHKLALDLAIENMRMKWALPLALRKQRTVKGIQDLEKLLNQGLPDAVRDIIKNTSPYGKFIKE